MTDKKSSLTPLAPDPSTKREFFSGYGEGYATVNIYANPEDVNRVNAEIWRWMKMYFGAGALLALVIPEDVLRNVEVLRDYTNLIASIIPFINWISGISSFPEAIALWYALMWPVLVLLIARYLMIFPYRYLPSMARRMGLFRHLAVVAAAIFGTWLLYHLMISGAGMQPKSYSAGHGRSMLALIADFRIGLAVIAPVLMLCQFILYQGTIGLMIALIARFVKGDSLS